MAPVGAQPGGIFRHHRLTLPSCRRPSCRAGLCSISSRRFQLRAGTLVFRQAGAQLPAIVLEVWLFCGDLGSKPQGPPMRHMQGGAYRCPSFSKASDRWSSPLSMASLAGTSTTPLLLFKRHWLTLCSGGPGCDGGRLQSSSFPSVCLGC